MARAFAIGAQVPTNPDAPARMNSPPKLLTRPPAPAACPDDPHALPKISGWVFGSRVFSPPTTSA